MSEITGKIQRKYWAHFIDAATTPDTPSYVRLGVDLEEYTEEFNANVSKRKNIIGETSADVDSYEVQTSVEPYYAKVGEPLFERLNKIADERLTLDSLKTTVVDVHLWESETDGAFTAYKEDAIIEIVNRGGDTTGLQIAFNIHYAGNRTKGTFNPKTKTFTPNAA